MWWYLKNHEVMLWLSYVLTFKQELTIFYCSCQFTYSTDWWSYILFKNASKEMFSTNAFWGNKSLCLTLNGYALVSVMTQYWDRIWVIFQSCRMNLTLPQSRESINTLLFEYRSISYSKGDVQGSLKNH